jgi:hypothetical protein
MQYTSHNSVRRSPEKKEFLRDGRWALLACIPCQMPAGEPEGSVAASWSLQ